MHGSLQCYLVTLGQKRELQRIQNSCIRTCLLYNRMEHVPIVRLHQEMNLISLEQRWRVQCLKLMYRISRKPVYLKKTNVHSRGNRKVKFKLMTKCTSKYLNSPLYKGATLWDEIEKNIQDMPTLKQFTKEIMKSYNVYVDLLN